MFQIFLCAVLIFMLLLTFSVIGTAGRYLLKIDTSETFSSILTGFFIYFSVFQIVFLPMVFKGAMIRWYVVIYCVVYLAMMSASLYLIRKNKCSFGVSSLLHNKYFYLFIVLVIFLAGISALQSYNGVDTAYYIGTMNEALHKGTFYHHNGNTGLPETVLPVRYVLSTFYVNFTVLAKIFGIEARLIAFYCIRPLCIILSMGIIYLFGMELFASDYRKTLVMSALFAFLNLFSYSIFVSSSFLIQRGYEAKGYCANVLFPAAVFLFYRLFRNEENEENKKIWRLLWIVGFSAVPISMSSLIIFPWLAAIGGIVLIIKRKSVRNIVLPCLIAVLPNILYFLVYYLSIKGIFVPEV